MGPGHLTLSEEERGFLLEELRFHLGGARRADIDEIERLQPCVEARDVPPELVPVLERLLEFELSSGTMRGRRGDEGERVAIHIYERTPRGRSLLEHMQRVNSELESLLGARVLDSRCVVPKFGELSVLLTTDRAEVMLTFTGAGLEVSRLDLAPAGAGGPTSSSPGVSAGRGPARAPAKRRAPPRRKSRRSGRR